MTDRLTPEQEAALRAELDAARALIARLQQAVEEGRDEEAEDELCSEAATGGFGAGFDRCLELVRAACETTGLTERQWLKLQSKLIYPSSKTSELASSQTVARFRELDRLRRRVADLEAGLRTEKEKP